MFVVLAPRMATADKSWCVERMQQVMVSALRPCQSVPAVLTRVGLAKMDLSVSESNDAPRRRPRYVALVIRRRTAPMA